ncbi:MAG: tyrosine-type recombinase/integrase, partial [Mycobacterium sp.]|nr:tyrosine-type recombinase/integrase [Mycobacterium sp.]
MTDLKRRRNGTGTKPHRRPGRSGWYCRIRVTDPVSGDHRRVVLSAPTKAELLEKRKAVARRTGAGLPAAASRVTVAGYAEEWVANHLPAREVAEGTRRLYRRMIKNHVVPQLGGLRLSSVRPVDVERLDAHLRSCGLSDSTRRSVRNVLSVMYSTAVRDGLVAANPTGLVPRPTERRVRRPQYDPAELERLFGAVAGERILGQLVPLLGWTALRIGEALALRWEDLSLDGPVPLLWVTGTRVDAPGTVGVRQPFPKDEEPRPVPLVPEAVAALRARWVEQAGEMLAAGDGWANPDGLVFTSRSGGMVEARNLRRRYARVLRQAG